jgi:hypothetical protein
MDTKDIRRIVGDIHDRIRKIDPFVTQVLQAHFLVEEFVDLLFEAVPKNPKHSKRKPTFAQKVKWIRASTPMRNDKRWRLLWAFNALRNNIAHKPDGPERIEALRNLRKEFERYLKSDGFDFDDQEWKDYNIVLASCSESRLLLAAVSPAGGSSLQMRPNGKTIKTPPKNQ